MNYSELSDFEINMLVAKHLHPGFKLIKSNSRPNCVVALDVFAEGCNIWLDYCNEVQDSWPIILDNKIATNPVLHDEWRASAEDDCGFLGYSSSNKNCLRAAMMVFLMLKGIE